MVPRGAGRRRFSETVELALLAGRHAIDTHQGSHHGRARNLVPALRAADDDALARYDVLVLPTTPMAATPIPPADAPREEVIAARWR